MLAFDEFDTILDGKSMNKRGFYTRTLPNIPSAVPRINSYTLPGRDGSLYERTGKYEDVDVTVGFNFISKDRPDKVLVLFREFVSIIRSATTLQFSDDQAGYRRIKKVEIGELQRVGETIGSVDVTFTLDPYLYHSRLIVAGNDSIMNPYGSANPIYTLEFIPSSDEDTSGQLFVNGSILEFSGDETMVINAELEVVYFLSSGKSALYQFELFDFDDIRLKHGKNYIGVNGSHWRLTTKCEFREVM